MRVARSTGRVVLLPILAVLCSSGCAGARIGGESGACAAVAPAVEVRPARVAPRGEFELRGEGFVGRYYCDDTGSPGSWGERRRNAPDRNIRVELVQGDRSWDLSPLDSDPDFAFRESLMVPTDAEPGAGPSSGPRAATPARSRRRRPSWWWAGGAAERPGASRPTDSVRMTPTRAHPAWAVSWSRGAVSR